jgi:hypothetical protein
MLASQPGFCQNTYAALIGADSATLLAHINLLHACIGMRKQGAAQKLSRITTEQP